MIGLNSVLVTLLYILGVALLVILIILGLKLINTVDKTNEILDDVNDKVQSLNGLFNAINMTTSTISSIGDKVVNIFATIVGKFVGKKKKKNKKEEEDLFYE